MDDFRAPRPLTTGYGQLSGLLPANAHFAPNSERPPALNRLSIPQTHPARRNPLKTRRNKNLAVLQIISPVRRTLIP